MSEPLISLCTTCCNRTHQLRAVFNANADRVLHDSNCEWVILNYGSSDDLDVFMDDALAELPGRFCYARCLEPVAWHASRAKNCAHRSSKGTIVMNLDCDNLIDDALTSIKHYFAMGVKMLHMWSGTHSDGTFGRIAATKLAFEHLGGYDEDLHPMGFQDADLLLRASAAGYAVIRARCQEGVAIKNSKQESIRSCQKDGYTWHDYDRENRETSMNNLRNGRITANLGGWGTAKVQIKRGRAQ